MKLTLKVVVVSFFSGVAGAYTFSQFIPSNQAPQDSYYLANYNMPMTGADFTHYPTPRASEFIASGEDFVDASKKVPLV